MLSIEATGIQGQELPHTLGNTATLQTISSLDANKRILSGVVCFAQYSLIFTNLTSVYSFMHINAYQNSFVAVQPLLLLKRSYQMQNSL